MADLNDTQMQFLYGILSKIPGKTQQQKLNYLQDWAKGLNVDLFGQPQEYVPQTAPVTYNATGQIYGNNEALMKMFNSIEQQGLDPITAAKLAAEKYPEMAYDPINKTGVNFEEIATQYYRDKLAADKSMAEYATAEADRQQAWQQDQPATLQDLFTDKYSALSEAAGQPVTADLLLKKYAENAIKQRGGASMGQKAFEEKLAAYMKPDLQKRLEAYKSVIVPTQQGERLLGYLPSLKMGG